MGMENNRKVAFIINDLEYFRKHYNLTDEQFNSMLADQKPFKAVYTLIGNDKTVDRYILTDMDGNKLYMDDLNGYERGVVLNDCYAYFTGGNYCDGGTDPCGVVEIKEETIK